MLKKKWSEIRVMEKGQLLIERAKEEIIEKIEVVRVVEKMKKTEVKVLRNNKQQIEDKLMLKKEKIYVLKNKSLRLEIIWLHYNTLIVEYGGQWNWLLEIIGGQKL